MEQEDEEAAIGDDAEKSSAKPESDKQEKKNESAQQKSEKINTVVNPNVVQNEEKSIPIEQVDE